MCHSGAEAVWTPLLLNKVRLMHLSNRLPLTFGLWVVVVTVTGDARAGAPPTTLRERGQGRRAASPGFPAHVSCRLEVL